MPTVWDFIAGAASYDALPPDQRALADEAMGSQRMADDKTTEGER